MVTLAVGGVAVTLSSLLCVVLVSVLVKVLHKLWWTPTRISKLMASQGIRGPPYKFIHGNTKQIATMRKEAMSKPKDLSHDILSVVQPHMHSWIMIYGKNYLQWHGTRAQFVITEPELCKEILNNKDRAYPKREVQGFIRTLLGDGLASTTEAEKWGKLRKIANHAFHGESLKSMFSEIVASAETMLERWKDYDGKEIEVFEEFKLFSSEVISRTAFGSSYIEGKNIFEMLNNIGFLIFKNALTIRIPGISKFLKTRDEIEAEKLEKAVHASIVEIVKKREEKAMTGGEDSFGSDFLGLLVKAYHDSNEDQRISMDDLVDECKTFYFAGQEAANTLLAWTVFLLALHTDWQEEARKEVIQLFGKHTLNHDGIAKMKTVSMIINESLRLYTPPVSVTRKVEREVRLGQLIVPANVDLVISTTAIHHDPQIWGKDAQLFKPDRFSEGVAKATNNNVGVFIPFGLGPRTCVGLNFAITEAKIALSMILQRYSFTLSPGYIHSPLHYLTVRPQHGVQLWNSDHGPVVEACKDRLKKLRLDYLDLYLVHFPVATKHTGVGTTGSALDEDGVLEIETTISLGTTWHAMEELVSMGLVRSIGISNYDIFLTRDCLAYSKVKTAMNQIETHPYFQRESLVKFCQKHGICVAAHTPLGGAVANSEWFGSVSCLDDPVLKNLAEKYKKTAAQVVLRWGIQRNTVVIPKTSKLERLKENFQVFDFELTKEDMDLIAKVDRKHRTNQPAKFWGVDLFA